MGGALRRRLLGNTHYALVAIPAIPNGIVTDTVLPAEKEAVVNEVSCMGAVFEPVYRNSWYAVRSDIEGATPESVHVTVRAVVAS